MARSALNKWKSKAKLLKRDAYALYLCSRHPDTPLLTKLFALLVVSYALSPIDLIPDFIPVLGYLDDLVLIPLGITLLIKMIPENVLTECRLKASGLPEEKSKKWVGAALVICLWALAVYIIYQFIFH